jgi:hypothetical protein
MDDTGTGTRPWTASRLWLWRAAATAVGVVLAFAASVALYSIIGEPADAFLLIVMTGAGLVIGLSGNAFSAEPWVRQGAGRWRRGWGSVSAWRWR